MSDQKLIELCQQIATGPDPAKLAKLIEDLVVLLRDEQDTIKANIQQRLKTMGGGF